MSQTPRKKLMVLAGEASGDLQAARVVQELLRLDPTLDVAALGGKHLRATAGVRFIEEPMRFGTIGFVDVIASLPVIYLLFCRVKRLLLQERPDLLLLIDSPGFNWHIARFARQHGIRTLYYFPPSAWSPNPERARRVRSSVDHVVAAFAYTAETYRRAGQDVAYFGHPLLDIVQPAGSTAEVRQRLKLASGKRFVTLLPGSRRAEVSRLSPTLFAAARRLAARQPDLHFLVPVALPSLDELVRAKLQAHGGVHLPVTVFDGQASDCMRVSELVLMISGSASLEAVILGVPMIMFYRLAALDWCIGQFLVRDFTYMGLPNLISGRLIVPELLQYEATPVRLEQEAWTLLSRPDLRQRMKDNLLEVKKQLGPPGAVSRVAQYIWETLSTHGPGRSHHHQ
jgi:lipid-A-disaccharide synthase